MFEIGTKANQIENSDGQHTENKIPPEGTAEQMNVPAAVTLPETTRLEATVIKEPAPEPQPEKKVKTKKPKVTWNDNEVKQMLSFAKGRDYIALGLGYFAALRVHEVTTLVVKNIDFENMTIWVYGKGSVRAPVPMLEDAQMFWTHLKMYVEKENPENFVVKGRMPGGEISDVHLNRLIKKYAKKANVIYAEKAHWHMLRRSRANNLYNTTGNMGAIKTLLRHSIRTHTEGTYVITPMASEKAREVFDIDFNERKRKKELSKGFL